MIASVQLQSMNFDDESFSPVFYRKRQEYFLELSDKVKNEAEKVIASLLSTKSRIFPNIWTNISQASATTPTGGSGPSTGSAWASSSPTSSSGNFRSGTSTRAAGLWQPSSPRSSRPQTGGSEEACPLSTINGATKQSRIMESTKTLFSERSQPLTASCLKKASGNSTSLAT